MQRWGIGKASDGFLRGRIAIAYMGDWRRESSDCVYERLEEEIKTNIDQYIKRDWSKIKKLRFCENYGR